MQVLWSHCRALILLQIKISVNILANHNKQYMFKLLEFNTHHIHKNVSDHDHRRLMIIPCTVQHL